MNRKESLGSYLKARREARGVPLDELVRETRIPRLMAEALEEDRPDQLPAAVFTRGFIRAYLRHLGLDAGEALALYRARFEPPASTPSPQERPGRLVWRPYVTVLTCLASGAVLSVALYVYGALTGPAAPPPPVPRVATKAPAHVAPEAPREEAAGPVDGPADAVALRLVVRATEPTWVRIETDEGRTVQELLPVSAVRELSAKSRFTLTVGNAGGIQLELNGRPLPPLGRSGEVIRDLVLPPKPVESKTPTDGTHP